MNAGSMSCGVAFSAACLVALSACSMGQGSAPTPSPPNPDAQPPGITVRSLFEGKSRHAEHVAPVVGGTLLVTRDGRTIAAADPDRDALFLVDASSHAVRAVPLSPGDEPGRIVEGTDGTLYVALRRAGAVVAVDVASASVAQRVPVCASPRGLAYDARNASVYVACRSGQLVTLDGSGLARKRTLQLDSDLRDVIVRDKGLLVTRFLSAEVMVVTDDGTVSRRATPDPEPGCGEATVAFRAFVAPSGDVMMAHQGSSNETVSAGPDAYGGGFGGCGGLVARFLTQVNPDLPSTQSVDPNGVPLPEGEGKPSAMTFHSVHLPGAGPLDVAFDATSHRVATIALDDSMAASTKSGFGMDSMTPAANLWLTPWGGSALPSVTLLEGGAGTLGVQLSGQPVAVAFDAAGRYVVQSREPAALALEDGSTISLSTESHADTGQQMFYMNSGVGISCSSCHPEGGDDGHVWHFAEGLRRTMPLEGGVMERAPFHWDGTLGDMTKLVNEVMVTRMALPVTPSDAQIATLGSFLEQLPNLPPADGLDGAAVQRGEALFRRADVACASCHSGPQYTNNLLVDVGTGGQFVTPTLLGVGLRPALFHDGCAKTIEQRFGVCGGSAHGKPELLSAVERADLIAFLRSL